MALSRNYGAGIYGEGVFGKATTYQLDAVTGSLTLSGQSAGLLQLHLTPGSYALTGSSASLLKGFAISASVGGFASSGNALLQYWRVFDVEQGGFLLGAPDTALAVGSIWSPDIEGSAAWNDISPDNEIWIPVSATSADWSATAS